MPVDHLNARIQTVGNYELVEKIADGGMGTVYKGRNRDTGEIVAVKVVPPHLLSNPVILKRFEQEYNVARLIDHPNIVKAIDFGRSDDSRYLVMEFVEGESLGQKIERDGRMSEDRAIRIITQVAKGLQKAHKQGLIHRDVKPDNILLTPDDVAKLTDLGLVKELEADLNLTRTGRGLGTPHFMAPEQFRNAKKADVRCDLYSLGATLYMMVTGALPFQSNGPLDAWMKKINNEIEPPLKLVPELSERIDWAIRRSMSPDPVQRPENCREFIEDLTGHSTRRLSNTDATMETMQDYWYMVYHDEAGAVHTVKGTLNGIRRSLKEEMKGKTDTIRIARSKAGPFEAVKQFPELRDLVVQPSKIIPTGGGNKSSRPSQAGVATAKKPSEVRNAVIASATKVPAKCSTDSLTTTQLSAAVSGTKSPATPSAQSCGPRIHINATHPSAAAEAWKWMCLALFFGGAGVLATLAMPMFRHLVWLFK